MNTPIAPLISSDANFQAINSGSGLKANGKIIVVSEPTADTDAATKEYVDSNVVTTLPTLSLTGTGSDTLLSAGQIHAASTENVNFFGFTDEGSLITNGGLKVEKDFFLNGDFIIPQDSGRQGTNTLSEGSAVIVNDTVTNYSCIYLTIQTPTNPGFLYVSSKTNGVGFTVTSSSATDESQFAWMIVENSFICFHSSSKVILRNGLQLRLDQLNHNDEVLVMDPVTNEMTYSKVITFTGYFPDRVGTCVTIYFGQRNPLILSNIHLVYSGYIPDLDTFEYVKAEDIEVGDYLLNSQGRFEKVERVIHTQNTGWISPLTETGTIVVNDVVASCHTTDHEFSSWFYGPLKTFYRYFPNDKNSSKGDHFYAVTIKRGLIGKLIQLVYNFFH